VSRLLTLAVLAAVGLVPAAAPAEAIVAAPATTTVSAPTRVVGWDTYRRLDLLPYLPTDGETRQFSSFDRSGGNTSDGGDNRYSCLRTTADGCVLAEAAGAGEIASIWFTRFDGDLSGLGRLKIVLDGQTVLDAAVSDVVDGDLGAPFEHPLVANAEQSSGGVYIKVPMPYRSSMRVTVQNNPGFYHLSYRRFPDPAGVTTFNPADRADDVLAKLKAAGSADPKPAQPGTVTLTRTLTLPAGRQATPVTLTGSGAITTLRLRLPQVSGHDPADDKILAGTRLRIAFDGHTTVDAPVGEFFGSGLGEYRVDSLLFAVDPAASGWYTTWWPMPYATSATVTLVNASGQAAVNADLSVTYASDPQWSSALALGGDAGYFTALSRRGDVEYGADWIFAELGGRGKVVGVSHTMSSTDGGPFGRTYLEGDERIHVDGSRSPQWHGTGTEDFYSGGWYFGNGPFSAPLTGHSAYERRDENNCVYACDAAYRIMLSDAVPFQSRLRFGIEHGGTNVNLASYGSTTFLYTQASRGGRLTDTLDTGDPAARTAHAYTEAGSASQADLAAVFEGDHDHVTVTDQVRATAGAVSFQMAIDPANRGVLLRRLSDQLHGYQAAQVLVDGVPAGLWSQPLGNPHQRWLEDGFALPASLTAGRAAITIRLEPLPGAPAWTAARYTTTSLVSPVRTRSLGGTDVDGDGRDDILSFHGATVQVALSTGGAFAPATAWHSDFGSPTGRWLTGDVDGDGRDDILSIGQPGIDVALSTGTAFAARTRWHDDLVRTGGWLLTGDVDGDGRDDIVTADQAAAVDVALSTGTAFAAPKRWHDFFAPSGETPALADVDGDGRDDLITFTHQSPWATVYLALSTGAGFAPARRWHDFFAPAGEYPRTGDVDGNGLADIVTFTQGVEADVYVALSTGTSFGPGQRWHDYFGPAGEYPRTGDVDGNGLADLVTFTRTPAADVFVATSDSWTFSPSRLWHDTFGFPADAVR
jgi:hypothetical protein